MGGSGNPTQLVDRNGPASSDRVVPSDGETLRVVVWQVPLEIVDDLVANRARHHSAAKQFVGETGEQFGTHELGERLGTHDRGLHVRPARAPEVGERRSRVFDQIVLEQERENAARDRFDGSWGNVVLELQAHDQGDPLASFRYYFSCIQNLDGDGRGGICQGE